MAMIYFAKMSIDFKCKFANGLLLNTFVNRPKWNLNYSGDKTAHEFTNTLKINTVKFREVKLTGFTTSIRY